MQFFLSDLGSHTNLVFVPHGSSVTGFLAFIPVFFDSLFLIHWSYLGTTDVNEPYNNTYREMALRICCFLCLV